MGLRLLGWLSLMVYIQSTVGQEGTLSASTVQPTELLDPVGQQAVILAQQLLAEFQSLASDFGEAERIYVIPNSQPHVLSCMYLGPRSCGWAGHLRR